MAGDVHELDIGLWSGFARRLMTILVGSGLLVGGLLTYVSTWKQKQQWTEFLHLRGQTLVRSLGRAAFAPLVLEDTAALDALAQGFLEESDVAYVALYGPGGTVLSQRPAGLALPSIFDARGVPEALSEHRVLFAEGVPVLDVFFPLRYGPGGQGSEGPGSARIGLSEDRVRQAVRRTARDNLLLCLGVMAAAFSAGVALVGRMTRRMRELIEQARSTAELRRSNKELEAFSYSVSHDLRAPLRSIDGFSHALAEDYQDKLDDQARDYLRRVRAGCVRMGRLIDDLLDLSRVIRQQMRREPVDLAVTARSVAGHLSEAEPDRRVVFSAPGAVQASGDPGLLRIVLENLLGNAWKFTRKQPEPRIEFGVTEKDGARAYFVRDNGAGFDMAYADKLFGAFQRLHQESDFPGTGIGLATVQRIIQRHGGRIWADSAPGRGAAFYFTLKEVI